MEYERIPIDVNILKVKRLAPHSKLPPGHPVMVMLASAGFMDESAEITWEAWQSLGTYKTHNKSKIVAGLAHGG